MAKKLSKNDLYKRFLKTADWFANSQLGDYRPEWNADRGRFLYYYYIPDDKYVPGINWTEGRGISVLAEAYKLTKKKIYLEKAILAARYLEALQYVNPLHKEVVGSFREETPQVDWCSVLDAAQAASALILLSKVAKDKSYLHQGKLFCDFLLRTFDKQLGFPAKVTYYPEPKIHYDFSKNRNLEKQCISLCIAIPLWHAYEASKEKKYLKPLLWAADKILPHQNENGSLNYMLNPEKGPKVTLNHHHGVGTGADKYVLRNDDGLITVLLAAYKTTKNKKYLQASVRYADWIVSTTPTERPFCVFPVQANTVLDVGRVAKKDYSKWVLDNLDKQILKLQVLDSKASKMAQGGFRGEDEEGDAGIFGGKGTDYVTTRVSCYAAGTLLRLSGKGNGGIFSVFGV